MSEERRERHHLIERLEERRERHREHNRFYRFAVVILGTVILLAGIVMTGPVPGPGILVIPIGLALLALEFVWAERLLETAVNKAEAARRKAADTSTLQKVLSGIAIALGTGAFVTAIVLWEIPLVPG